MLLSSRFDIVGKLHIHKSERFSDRVILYLDYLESILFISLLYLIFDNVYVTSTDSGEEYVNNYYIYLDREYVGYIQLNKMNESYYTVELPVDMYSKIEQYLNKHNIYVVKDIILYNVTYTVIDYYYIGLYIEKKIINYTLPLYLVCVKLEDDYIIDYYLIN